MHSLIYVEDITCEVLSNRRQGTNDVCGVRREVLLFPIQLVFRYQTVGKPHKVLLSCCHFFFFFPFDFVLQSFAYEFLFPFLPFCTNHFCPFSRFFVLLFNTTFNLYHLLQSTAIETTQVGVVLW